MGFLILLIIVVGGGLLIARAIANKKAGKQLIMISHLQDKMNNAQTIGDYYNSRDQLVALLQKLARYEKFVSEKYRPMPKASALLMLVYSGEEQNISYFLQNTYSLYHDQIKSHKNVDHNDFLAHVQPYLWRISSTHQKTVNEYADYLKALKSSVGKIAYADALEGHEFEHWCAGLLLKNGFSEATVTKGSGDQGIDIVAVKNNVRYAIQCKCYSNNLDNTPVQEAVAGKRVYDCDIAAVMTNRYFTDGAKELAEINNVILWDRDSLINMLQRAAE